MGGRVMINAEVISVSQVSAESYPYSSAAGASSIFWVS